MHRLATAVVGVGLYLGCAAAHAQPSASPGYELAVFEAGPPYASIADMHASPDGTVHSVEATGEVIVRLGLTGDVSLLPMPPAFTAMDGVVRGDGRPGVGTDLFVVDADFGGSTCCDGSVWRLDADTGVGSPISFGAPGRGAADPSGVAFAPFGSGYGDALFVVDFQGRAGQAPLIFTVDPSIPAQDIFTEGGGVWGDDATPVGIDFTTGGNFGIGLYAVDPGSAAVWFVDRDGVVSPFAVGGLLDRPTHIAAAPGVGDFDHDLAVSDADRSAVLRLHPDASAECIAGGLSGPLAFLPNGDLLAADGNTIYRISVSDACPADLNADGILDVFDFLEFQNAFARGQAAADFDRDCDLDLFDFLAFQNVFGDGCG
ncbi:MAG: GC-type dockerin domain-anchored protein [Planctomycetota bacterium]